MIYTYHYLSTMTGNQPHFSLQNNYFFQLYTGPKPPQNVDEIQTLIENEYIESHSVWENPWIRLSLNNV